MPGFKHLEEKEIDEVKIRLLPLAYFLATKFSAFHDRGGNDARTSHDFEDITYILDNRVDLAEVILKSPFDAKSFLKTEFEAIVKNSQLQEAISGNLFYETRTDRFNMIFDKLNKIVADR